MSSGHYLNTRGLPSLAVAICDRCHMKRPYSSLSPDVNSPGLMCCPGCGDLKDPYQLPPRKTEIITLDHPRLDERLST